MTQDLTISQPISKSRFLAEVPQETVWLSNFISPHTKKTYLLAVREFVGFHKIQSAEDLQYIDQAHVIAWRDSLISQGAAAKTINAKISAISSLFKHLCEKQIAKRNPTIGVRRPPVETKEVKAPLITPAQVREILNAPRQDTLKGIRDSAILHILFYTGCRISEVGKRKKEQNRYSSGVANRFEAVFIRERSRIGERQPFDFGIEAGGVKTAS